MAGQSLAERSAQANAPAQVRPEDTVRAMIQRQQTEIARALPRTLDPDRFARILVTEVKANKALMQCEPASLMAAVMKAASLGVEPGPLGHVYLVPFKGKVTMILGYKGIIDLARRSGQVSSLYAEVVYEGDVFHYQLGLHRNIEHERGRTINRSRITHAYAVAHYKDGGFDFAVLDEIDIADRRRRSMAGDSGPWKTDFAAMARKSAVRALAPFLPLTVEAAKAVQVDEGIYRMSDLEDAIDVGDIDHEPEREPAKAIDRETGEVLEADEATLPIEGES